MKIALEEEETVDLLRGEKRNTVGETVGLRAEGRTADLLVEGRTVVPLDGDETTVVPLEDATDQVDHQLLLVA